MFPKTKIDPLPCLDFRVLKIMHTIARFPFRCLYFDVRYIIFSTVLLIANKEARAVSRAATLENRFTRGGGGGKLMLGQVNGLFFQEESVR